MSNSVQRHEFDLLVNAVSGGAGAVGTTVGKAVLESGGDVVFVDMAPSHNVDTWSKLLSFFELEYT